jgi:hypothetical protein
MIILQYINERDWALKARPPEAQSRRGVRPMELQAVEYIRPIDGDSQPHLLRCSDDHYYVVKVQNNRQGVRVLANEFLAARIATELGLPVPPFAVIGVPEDIVKYSKQMVVRTKERVVPCQAGLCFGSRLVHGQEKFGAWSPNLTSGHLPNSELRDVMNLSDFIGMLVFDKWTGNIDRRQVIFSRSGQYRPYNVSMIDNGYCFGGPSWKIHDFPMAGLYSHDIVYREIRGLSAFEPWLLCLDRNLNRAILRGIQNEVPKEWYGYEWEALTHLVDELDQRREKLRMLLWETLLARNNFFPKFALREAGKCMDYRLGVSRPCPDLACGMRTVKRLGK